ncbi:MAG: hypothetical protein AB9882_03510 [Ignavibacteriaceae bacterium]
MHKFLICFILLVLTESWGQSHDDVSIKISSDSTAITIQYPGQTFFLAGLSSPKILDAELNNDDRGELIVINRYVNEGLTLYSAYVINLFDSIYVIDSIRSGIVEPFLAYSEEVSSTLLIIGYPEIDSLNRASAGKYSPINALMYDGSKIYSVNEEVYSLFIDEIEDLLLLLEGKPIHTGCEFTKENSSLIASIYINYVNAGDLSMAALFLKNYYFCTDYVLYKEYLRNLLGL